MPATVTFLRFGQRVSAPICLRCRRPITLSQTSGKVRESCGCPK